MDQSRSRFEVHWPRRLFHMFSGLIIVGLGFYIESKNAFIGLLIALTAVSIVIEGLRLFWKPANRFIMFYFGKLAREEEYNQVSGIFYYALGCCISAIVFPKAIALLAIFYLAVGDPVAAIVGVLFGKTQAVQGVDIDSKSVEGSLACFLVCAIVTLAATYSLPKIELEIFSDRLLFAALGGLSAMIGELIPLKTDDNLALPVVSGALLWFAASILNLLPGLYLN